jgi:hypothetical protein
MREQPPAVAGVSDRLIAKGETGRTSPSSTASNKPPACELIRIWRRALESAPDLLPLGSLSVTSSMVYWADLLYAEPEQDTTAFEGLYENTAAAIDGAGGPPPPEPGTPEERAFLDSLRAKMTTLSDEQISSGAAPDVPPEPQGHFCAPG